VSFKSANISEDGNDTGTKKRRNDDGELIKNCIQTIESSSVITNERE